MKSLSSLDRQPLVPVAPRSLSEGVQKHFEPWDLLGGRHFYRSRELQLNTSRGFLCGCVDTVSRKNFTRELDGLCQSFSEGVMKFYRM